MKIFDYEEVVMNWDSFTYPIAVGTPVSIDGVLADNAAAHGLIARTVFAKPDADETLKVMTGGFIDMEEIVAGYGQELSSEAVQALCGIHFYKNGVCIPTGGSGGGGSDDQKWHETTTAPLFSETVTTVDEYGRELEYADIISQDTIVVTFDGVEYTCPVYAEDGVYYYGGTHNPETESVDYSEYPFSIASVSDGNFIQTENIGTHTVSVSAETTTYTEEFVNAVHELSALVETENYHEASFCVITIGGAELDYANQSLTNSYEFSCSNNGASSYSAVTSVPPYYKGTMVLTRSIDGTFVGEVGLGEEVS